MAYLTKSNSLKIIAGIDYKQYSNTLGEVYIKPIFFFSNSEKSRLLIFKEFLKNPENFITKFYIPIVTTDNLKFVYEGMQPAYHSTPDCPRLNSNYKNFEIPEQIREKGEDEVKRFRSWFKNNQNLLEKPDIFVARLEMAFGVSMNAKSIDYENSGVEIKENLNLEELEKRINNIISDAGQYYTNANEEKKDIIRKFQKKTFLAYSSNSTMNNDTRFEDEVIKKFLKQYDIHFKKPLKDLLIEYYRVKHNPDLNFEGHLLEQLGFKACGACHLG